MGIKLGKKGDTLWLWRNKRESFDIGGKSGYIVEIEPRDEPAYSHRHVKIDAALLPGNFIIKRYKVYNVEIEE